MKRKVLWVGLGVVALVIAAPLSCIKVREARLQRGFQDELALARKEGIPTTAEEFVAPLLAVEPSENAAPFYNRLRPLRPWKLRPQVQLESDLVFKSTPGVKALVRRYLAQAKPCLDIADRAAAYPHCRFDRDYTKGMALVNPELSDMKFTALLVLLRGSLAASENRVSDAVADARKAARIGRHLEEDPLHIGILVSRSINFTTANFLARWAYAHPGERAYRRELQALVDGIPQPKLQEERRYGLIVLLTAIDLCETEQGRREVGLRPGDESRAEGLASLFQPKPVGRIRIVKGWRALWAALADTDTKRRDERVAKAESEVNGGLLSFPTAMAVVDALGGTTSPSVEIDDLAARKLLYRAFLRAAGAKKIAKVIKTSDLVSPLDGKPVRYSFDGRQIVISAGKNDIGNEVKLAIPPASK